MKVKKIDTEFAIAKSMAINKQRLEKIKQRQEVMKNIQKDSVEEMVKQMSNEAQSKLFIQKLIVQGLLMLLEREVVVKCRKSDKQLVQSVISSAQEEYAKIIKDQTGAEKSCELTIDEEFLAPAPPGEEGRSCLGGVFLSCFGGKITVDNTVDMRLRLVLEQDKPTIRKLLFPSA